MTVMQLPENRAISREIRNSGDYHRIANYLNYGTAPVCIKKIHNDTAGGIGVDIPALTGTDWPPWYEKLRRPSASAPLSVAPVSASAGVSPMRALAHEPAWARRIPGG